ncbi:helix-turn-helix domain-containing protein [Mesorhizobium sp. M0761]|uniref:helix-turn-helix domain-containing protein n=1 Tax=Mesorhizobium sp. M0761 TaxID=2956994 RepID=UPI003336B676
MFENGAIHRRVDDPRRQRVVAYVDEGHGHREAARHFRVSPRFVNNLINLRRQTGSLEARRQGHVGGGKLEPHAEFVRLRLAETGELTQLKR